MNTGAQPRLAPARRGPAATTLFALVAFISFAAIAAALVSQHRFGMMPCPWCVLQRLLFLKLGVLAFIGLAWRSLWGTRICAVLAMLVAGTGAVTALWQHFVASRSQSCNLTLADRLMSMTGLDTWLPAVFEAKASCADAAVDLFGVPYPFWSLALFLLAGAAMLTALLQARR
ncbi:MAG: disulfide bond formation protein B [Caldimonas sp.]